MRWAVLVVVAGGCAVVAPVPVENRVAVQNALRSVNAPLPLRVAVVCEHNSEPPFPDPVEVAKALELLFASVKRVTPDALPHISDRTASPKFHLIVRLKTGKVEARFLARTKWRVPKIIVWSLSEFLSALIADEKYKVTGQIEVKVVSPFRGATPLFQTRQKIQTEVVLNDWQRGFKFWGIWFVPKWLKPHNLRRVAEHAIPRLQEEAKAAVLTALSDFFRKVGISRREKLLAWLGVPTPRKHVPKKPIKFLTLAIVEHRKKRSAEKIFETVSTVFGYPDARFVLVLPTPKRLSDLMTQLKKRKVTRALVYIGLESDGKGGFSLNGGEMKLQQTLKDLRESGVRDCLIIVDGRLSPKALPDIGGWLLLASCRPGERDSYVGGITQFADLFCRYVRRWRKRRLDSESLRADITYWFRRQLRIRRVKQTIWVVGGAFGSGER